MVSDSSTWPESGSPSPPSLGNGFAQQQGGETPGWSRVRATGPPRARSPRGKQGQRAPLGANDQAQRTGEQGLGRPQRFDGPAAADQAPEMISRITRSTVLISKEPSQKSAGWPSQAAERSQDEVAAKRTPSVASKNLHLHRPPAEANGPSSLKRCTSTARRCFAQCQGHLSV